MSVASQTPSKPTPRRSLPPVIRITDAAAERLRVILADAPEPGTAVRVGVETGGCAGMSYKLDFTTEVGPLDAVVEDKGVKVVVDSKAVLFLLGTEMDFAADKVSAQFVFNNPNQTSSCGCGESVAITPVVTAEPSAQG